MLCRCTYVVVLYHDVCVAVHSLHNKHLWSRVVVERFISSASEFQHVLLYSTECNNRKYEEVGNKTNFVKGEWV